MTENNPNEEARQLLEKYLRGACTAEEEKLVLRWFYNHNIEPILSEEDKNTSLKRSKDALMQIVTSKGSIPIQSKNRFRWKAAAIAASITILLTSISIVWKQTKQLDTVHLAAQTVDSSGKYKNDILPGSHYAALTYPNGEKLTLGKSNEISELKSNGTKGQLKLEVPKAGTYELLLSDGTKVWLNASSSLDYPDEFTTSERRVRLTGEAYFDVAKDSKRPFRIEVEQSVIEVLGTAFNVNAYNSKVSTCLVEGKVKILNQGRETYLDPGNEAVVKGNQVTIHATDILKTTAWQRGEFYFDGSDLTEVFGQIARWYNVEFTNLKDLEISNTYNGSISRESKLSEVLNILSYVIGHQFEIEGREISIK